MQSRSLRSGIGCSAGKTETTGEVCVGTNSARDMEQKGQIGGSKNGSKLGIATVEDDGYELI